MEQFVISANLESAAARGDQRERFDALAELKNFGRQTDGLRRVVSNDAVFDRDLGLHRQTPFRERSYRRDERRSRNAPTIVALVLKSQRAEVSPQPAPLGLRHLHFSNPECLRDCQS
jgi:hypothetical protein